MLTILGNVPYTQGGDWDASSEGVKQSSGVLELVKALLRIHAQPTASFKRSKRHTPAVTPRRFAYTPLEGHAHSLVQATLEAHAKRRSRQDIRCHTKPKTMTKGLERTPLHSALSLYYINMYKIY